MESTSAATDHSFSRAQLAAFLLMVEGVYYMIGGLWPLVSVSSFLFVTGPKTDIWLVRTVGLLITVIGSSLFASGVLKRFTAEIGIIAVGCPLVLLLVDVIYSLRGVISPIYLLDAAIEAAILGAWFYLWNKGFLVRSKDYLESLKRREPSVAASR